MTAELHGLRALLASGEPVLTMLMNIADPAVGELLGRSGIGYVIIDTEHAFYPSQSLRECIAAIRATGTPVVVRVPANEEHLVKTVLDLGADGVQIPNVKSAEEAARAVSFTRYAPEGVRGVGYGRASGHGVDIAEYVAGANARIALIVMIESGRGVAAAEEIAAVPGVDALVVGPADLATDLGLGLQVDAPELHAAFRTVIAAGRRHGIPVAVGGGVDQAQQWYDEGARVFLHFVDSLALDRAAKTSVAASRAALGLPA